MDYSIIIPHYNSSHLLKRLLDSIPQNGYFQVIVIDDNSKQEECERLKDLQAKYNFELYKNDGRTAGGARNTGLKHATGRWIIFADADDYFEPKMEQLLDRYKDSIYDIVFFDATSRYSDTGNEAYRNEHIRKIMKLAQENNEMDFLRCCYTVPWGKMYRREMIADNNCTFDEVPAGNDMWFAVCAGLAAKEVTFDNDSLYCNTVTGNSITTTLTKEKFESRFQVTLRVNDLLRKRGKNKHQISVLYFLGTANQFGAKYQLHVINECLKHRSNIFIGMSKLLHVKGVMKDRQNTTISTTNR